MSQFLCVTSGSLSGGSFLGGSLGLGLSGFLGGSLLGSEFLSALLGYSLTFETVLLSLGLETSLAVSCGLSLVLCYESCGFLVASSLPCVETLLCLCLVERAFLDASSEVLHQHHALFRKQ